ncbi:YsnF/AvaK domain-containing protein [Clostridium sp. FP1]|uniref:YsnF/AvaK domain-containing protein n=1 Tax=Clostridium sp. FP1 TaxID=2724076 RepID=UPI0013E8FB1D|nr:YsnF/AvaK domain-containing protein [Clostridium sp. FP1]MBZ9635464.1 YsnF/AvaK domain-containing protein [Clostridium sp. FP1]
MKILEGFINGDGARKETSDKDAKIRLRKEELDIAKSSVHKGDVEFGKEIIEEQKSVDVPVMREEIVIERKSLNNEASDSPITKEQTIRIPVNEEKVNIDKHTVITSEISAHKRAIEDTEHIDETLKREEVLINKTGNPDIVDIETHQ